MHARLLLSIWLIAIPIPTLAQTTPPEHHRNQQDPSSVRRLTAPVLSRSSALPHYNMFEVQYYRFANRYPFAHLALAAKAKGDTRKADEILNAINRQDNVEALTKLLPSISASLGASMTGAVGGKSKGAEFSIGPSISIDFNISEAAETWRSKSLAKEHNAARFSVRTSADEIQLVAQMLMFYDHINASSRKNGGSVIYSDSNAPELAFRTRLASRFGDLPIFQTSLAAQAREFLNPRDARLYLLSEKIASPIKKLKDDDFLRFFAPETSSAARLRMLGLSKEEIGAAITDALGGRAGAALRGAPRGNEVDALIQEFAPPDEQYRRQMSRFASAIQATKQMLNTKHAPIAKQQLERDLLQLTNAQRYYERSYQLRELDTSISNLRAEAVGFAQIISLFDAATGRDVQAKANAALDVTMAIGRMHAGDINLSSMGQLVGGLQSLFSTPPPDPVLMQLADIFNLQKEIVKRLDIVDKKLDFISGKLSQLIEVLTVSSDQLTDRLIDIKLRLDEIQGSLIKQAGLIEDAAVADNVARVEEGISNAELALERLAPGAGVNADLQGRIDAVHASVKTALEFTAIENPAVRPPINISAIRTWFDLAQYSLLPGHKKSGAVSSAILRIGGEERIRELPNLSFSMSVALRYLALNKMRPISQVPDPLLPRMCTLLSTMTDARRIAAESIPRAIKNLQGRITGVSARLNEALTGHLSHYWEQLFDERLRLNDSLQHTRTEYFTALMPNMKASIEKVFSRLKRDKSFKSTKLPPSDRGRKIRDLDVQMVNIAFILSAMNGNDDLNAMFDNPSVYFNERLNKIDKKALEKFLLSEEILEIGNSYIGLGARIALRGTRIGYNREKILKRASEIFGKQIVAPDYFNDRLRFRGPGGPPSAPPIASIQPQVDDLRSKAKAIAVAVLAFEIEDVLASPVAKRRLGTAIASIAEQMQNLIVDLAALEAVFSLGASECYRSNRNLDQITSILSLGDALTVVRTLERLILLMRDADKASSGIDVLVAISIRREIDALSTLLDSANGEGVLGALRGCSDPVHWGGLEGELQLMHELRSDLMPSACVKAN